MFSLRGPLCAGEAFFLLRRAGAERRDVGPRKELVPRPFTPHISAPLRVRCCYAKEGGSRPGEQQECEPERACERSLMISETYTRGRYRRGSGREGSGREQAGSGKKGAYGIPVSPKDVS